MTVVSADVGTLCAQPWGGRQVVAQLADLAGGGLLA